MKFNEFKVLAEAQFNSKQEVIDHFVKQGKSAAAGASAWERGWRGSKPAAKKPTGPVRNYHDDQDDKRYSETNEGVDALEAQLAEAALGVAAGRPARAGTRLGRGHQVAERYTTVGEAHPKQQASVYNPDGSTYRGEKMPTLDPEDPASRADRLTQQNSPSVDDASDDVADKVDKEILRKLVKKHMKLMTPDEREVVNYSFWHNLDYKDIAAKMGITKERARKLESEALRKLKHPSVSDTLLGHARPLKRDTENTPWNSTPTVDSFKKEFPQLHAAARRPGQDPETAAVDFMYGHNKPLRPVREDIELLEAELAEARMEYNKKSASMEVNKDDADQRHGLYIDGKLVKTQNSREEAENVKKRDPKFKGAEIKKIAEATIEEHFCEDCGGSLAEAGKATRALCVSSKSDAELGASQLASCKSQGLRAREGKKSHLVGKDRITVGGKKMKGKKYGGSIPDWS